MQINAERIRVEFGDFVALDDVSLEVAKGAFVTLLGPSGCGKTTLLNVLAGFLRPTRGRILANGQDITLIPPEQRNSAMCFQSYALFPHLSVRENIAFGPRQKRVPAAQREQRVDALIEQVALAGHADKLPNALSGGQQQRVALARALALQPELILFDEPLSNLDAKLRDQVRLEIRQLQNQLGFTAIYVTHDQSEALAMSDHIFVLNKGVIEQSGVPAAIYNQPETRFVADFIGGANLLDAPILETTESQSSYQSAFGVITGPVATASTALQALAWRPERAKLLCAPRAGSLSGEVFSTAFQGAYTDVYIHRDNETARLQLPGQLELHVGDRIDFELPADSIILLGDERA